MCILCSGWQDTEGASDTLSFETITRTTMCFHIIMVLDIRLFCALSKSLLLFESVMLPVAVLLTLEATTPPRIVYIFPSVTLCNSVPRTIN